MSGRPILHGATSKSTRLRAFSAVTFLPTESIAYDSPGIELFYHRNGQEPVEITPAELMETDSAWASGGFIHLGKGFCRLDSPNAALIAGVDSVLFYGSATDIILVGQEHPLITPDLELVYSRLGTPAGASLAEDIANITPSSYRVLLGSTVSTGRVISNDIEVYKDENRDYTWTIVDSETGDPVNLSGKEFQLVVQKPCGTDLFTIDSGTVSGAFNNLVTVATEDTDNATTGRYNYGLWNTTDKHLLAKGKYRILECYGEDPA